MDFSQECVLITGGAGFIGSHIVETLVSHQFKPKLIRIFDNLSTGYYDNISQFLGENVEFMLGDITNLDQCHQACKGITMICHQAALGSVTRSVEDPIKSHINNVDGFMNLLVAAKDNHIRRIVYASSSSVYGDNQDSIKSEDKQGHPLSPYAINKCVNELYAKLFTNLFQLQCIGLRYFNVFGPRQNPNGDYAAVIPKFTNLLIAGRQPIIYGDGEYSRDFTYVNNIVNANLLALSTTNQLCFGEAFNVGTQNKITINHLFLLLTQKLKLEHIYPIYKQNRPGDVSHSQASIDKIKTMLKYQTQVNFTEGLDLTIAYLLNQKD
jgi:UDP-N-acetylglucosamine 4-epimerase